MRIADAIRERRSIKRFTDRPVTKEEIEALLDAATHAPNHRLTQPWRFYVLGPDARYAYGLAVGERKARKLDDTEAARTMRATVAAEHRALPAMIAAAGGNEDNPQIREEDYAADQLAEGRAEPRERVLDAGRHLGIYGASHQPVTLHAAQRHGQHSLADPFDLVSQLVEPQCPGVVEHVDHVDRPLVADARQHFSCVAVRRVVLQLGRPLDPRLSHWLLRSRSRTFACLLQPRERSV